MIKKVRLAGVPVSDQHAALDFYTNKLGFEVQTDVTMGNGYRWIEVVPPGADTALTLFKPYPVQDGGGNSAQPSIVFGTDDIAATYEELSAKGVEFVEAPAMQPWGVKQAIFRDPDGHSFVLVERL